MLLTGDPKIQKLACDAFSVLAPPPELTVSQWADQKRRLSSESSPEPGEWNTDRAPYQREVMDTFTQEDIHTLVLMWSAQVGKSEILLNILGYLMDLDPCPILMLQPTLTMAEAFSKDRVSPMLRDCPTLSTKAGKVKAKGSDNTILQKTFPGGYFCLAGANSPSSLASRPIRVVLDDEVDRFPVSAGAEGDPVALAYKRTNNFWNRKQVLTSTPTVKDASRIESAFEASDKRRYFVPCPDCGELQTLKFGLLKFTPEAPEDAYYECEACQFHIEEHYKPQMLRAGRWIATAVAPGIAGFHLNELYSPWIRWGKIAEAWLEAKRLPETLKVFINTSLGETWEERGEGLTSEKLMERVEDYGPKVPMDAMLLTCGVDVQNDRIELEVVAWGDLYESWSMDYRVFVGNPGKPEIWRELDEYLATDWEHESGLRLPLKRVCIDSGGSFTEEVYRFVRQRQNRGIFAIKGGSKAGLPLISKPSTNNKGHVRLYIVGPDTGKELIHSRLKIEDHGPGYCHFRADVNDQAYFDGLTSEKVKIKYVKGFAQRVWEKKSRDRNEPIDCRNYAQAALAMLKPDWTQMAKNFKRQMERLKQAPAPPKKADPMAALVEPEPTTKKRKPLHKQRKRGGFVHRW